MNIEELSKEDLKYIVENYDDIYKRYRGAFVFEGEIYFRRAMLDNKFEIFELADIVSTDDKIVYYSILSFDKDFGLMQYNNIGMGVDDFKANFKDIDFNTYRDIVKFYDDFNSEVLTIRTQYSHNAFDELRAKLKQIKEKYFYKIKNLVQNAGLI